SKKVGPLVGFHSHKGRPFTAVVKLNAEHKIEFDFGGASDEDINAQTAGNEPKEPVGKCPVCTANVIEAGSGYACEKSLGKTPSCTFRSGSIILQQPIDRTQMTKLLETGKTDLFTAFISRKGRPFKAFLVIREGKVGFEFLPRKIKEKKEI
ncbi:MAG: topoisomerase C-terminal repeat-containing protein, partial [Kiritimatiellia bacterium]|nr:topoisomerase C-terminal repeat-containing protein [Kiritimatiellia bacterium]